MSYFEELRRPAAKADTVVNDQKIEEPTEETKGTNEVSNTNKGTPKGVKVNDNEVNADASAAKREETLLRLHELKDVLENEPATESLKVMANGYLSMLAKQHNFSFESVNDKTALLNAVDQQVLSLESIDKSPFGALRNAIRDTWAKFAGYDYFKDIYSAPVFNLYKSDKTNQIDYIMGIFDGNSKIVAAMNEAFAGLKFNDADIAVCFDNGRLADPKDVIKGSVNLVNSLIKTIGTAASGEYKDLKDLLAKVKPNTINTSMPNLKIVVDGNKLAVKHEASKAGRITYNQFSDWFNDVSSMITPFGKDVRKLETALHAEIKKVEKSGNELAKVYSQLVASVSVIVLTSALRYIEVLNKQFMNTVRKAAESSEVKHEITMAVGKEKTSKIIGLLEATAVVTVTSGPLNGLISGVVNVAVMAAAINEDTKYASGTKEID